MKKNIASWIFAIAFLVIAILRWNSTQLVDHVFYLLAVAGFVGLGILTNYKRKSK